MKIRLAFLRLVRGIDPDRSERRRLAAAAVILFRQRRRSLKAVEPFLRVLPTCGNSKLQLWHALATSRSDSSSQVLSSEKANELAKAIRSTHAYTNCTETLSRNRIGFLQRGFGYGELRQCWRVQPPERILVFHHYDHRGLIPQSWCEALIALQAAGWQVVVSSSYLEPDFCALLESAGVQVCFRSNLGLCLGAYRDLALLIHSIPVLHRKLKSLVLCNDSNLLVQPPEVLVDQLKRWSSDSDRQTTDSRPFPILAGLTDSVERQSYHLQSFLLHANRALLHHPAWLRFWLNFSIDGSKDELIDQGEIGLSQALLGAGVQLQPAYPLVQGLLNDPAMAVELQGYGIAQPEHVNQSLFSWRSLLARGFPLVKKHVLFQLVEHQGQPIAIAELAGLIPKERRALLTRDIEQLLISRYSVGSPQMS